MTALLAIVISASGLGIVAAVLAYVMNAADGEDEAPR